MDKGAFAPDSEAYRIFHSGTGSELQVALKLGDLVSCGSPLLIPMRSGWTPKWGDLKEDQNSDANLKPHIQETQGNLEPMCATTDRNLKAWNLSQGSLKSPEIAYSLPQGNLAPHPQHCYSL